MRDREDRTGAAAGEGARAPSAAPRALRGRTQLSGGSPGKKRRRSTLNKTRRHTPGEGRD